MLVVVCCLQKKYKLVLRLCRIVPIYTTDVPVVPHKTFSGHSICITQPYKETDSQDGSVTVSLISSHTLKEADPPLVSMDRTPQPQ